MAKSILIVDDSASIRQILRLTLEAEGFRVEEARDGQDAIDKLIAGNKFNLVICDVNMPQIDGISFVRRVKNDEELKDYRFLPVLMLTTESSSSKKQEGKDAGARAWITKPFIPGQLMEVVNKIIS